LQPFAVHFVLVTVTPGIRKRELEISRTEQRLRTLRQQPNIERLRDALMQRVAEWKQMLRTDPRGARLLRRLIGSIERYNASKPEWQMPDFIKAEAVVKTGLIAGLAEMHDVASPAATVGDRAIRKYRMWRPQL
jgi:hypothetical protein